LFRFCNDFRERSRGCQSGGRVSSRSVFEEKFAGLTQLSTSTSIFYRREIPTQYRRWLSRLIRHKCAIVEPLSCCKETYEEQLKCRREGIGSNLSATARRRRRDKIAKLSELYKKVIRGSSTNVILWCSLLNCLLT